MWELLVLLATLNAAPAPEWVTESACDMHDYVVTSVNGHGVVYDCADKLWYDWRSYTEK